MLLEWSLIALLLLGASLLIFARGAVPFGRLAALILIAAALLGTWWWQGRLQAIQTSTASVTVPHVGRPDEYAGSAACQACHPDQYSSWHRSFHRTMTQTASPESIRGNFENVNLTLDGELYKLQRRGDEFWIEMTDPDWKLSHPSETAPPNDGAGLLTLAQPKGEGPDSHRALCRVSLVTGSHHMQAYWIDNGHGNRQFSFPFTYMFDDQRWVPRRSVFIKDPAILPWSQVWNVGCVDCHSTAGEPAQQPDPNFFDTRVAEFGIACEACHGPAAEHVRRNSNPLRRYALHFQGKGDPTIVNPTRLSSKRSSDICGRCHSVHKPRDESDWLAHGESFHPGDDLQASMELVRQRSFEVRPKTRWTDGMIRISGREYSSMIESPCYLKGEMSCGSCHSMHESSPTNQIAAKMESNAACLQCHQNFAKNLTAHTHHAADSSGSLCYNCHMPYTTYGLVKALRSHQISNPSVVTSLQTGRPNACNLCHLDKTLDWTSQTLNAWYQTPAVDLPPVHKAVAASVVWALKGDAGQRALMAWHMGWPPAREASGSAWLAPYLAPLLDDPYPAVRYIAGHSIQRLPGFEKFSYDYVTPVPADLRRDRERAMEIWSKTKMPADNPAILIENGALQSDTLEVLLKARNNHVVELLE